MSMTAWARTNTTVERLTIRYPGEHQGTAGEMNATTLRLRVERLLEMADLQPVGLPSGAVFIVRKLESLTPLSIAALAHSSLPTWREGVRGQMQTLYAMAARPANGPIPPGAASVLFNDPGELLICLTRDLLAGCARQRWYWQPFLRNIPHPPGAALATLWSNQASIIPTALASLNIAEAISTITLLSPVEVFSITRALHASFGLPSEMLETLRHVAALPNMLHNIQPSQVISPTRPHPIETFSKPPGEKPSLSDIPRERSVYPAVVPPPWRRWLAHSTVASLAPQAHYLLGLGLSLYQAPSYARSTKFAQQAIAWLHSLSAEPNVTGDKAEQASLPPTPLSQPRTPSIAHATESTAKAPSPETVSDLHLDKPAGSHTATTSEHASSSPASAHTPVTATSEPSKRNTSGKPTSSALREFSFADAQLLPSEGFPTALGGILYLIHLLTWLDLPGGWDEDGALSEGLSGWAIVEALARGLLGALLAAYADDPIWHLLALLDRRQPDEPIGMGLPQQTAFRLPAQWLLWYGSRETAWRVKGVSSRLLIFDEGAGYLVADIPLAGHSLEEAVLAEGEAYRSRGVDVRWCNSRDSVGAGEASGGVGQGGVGGVGDFMSTRWGGEAPSSPPLDAAILPHVSEQAAWWQERVLGFVHFFILRRLGDPELDAGRLATLLLERPGQLIASRTHIDLHMSMEHINLPIRRAGLDRDPGWIPDLGRIVLFHFD